jgi:nitroreductase
MAPERQCDRGNRTAHSRQVQWSRQAGSCSEPGHAAQNVLLQARAIGLCAVPVGAFDDDEVRTILVSQDDILW